MTIRKRTLRGETAALGCVVLLAFALRLIPVLFVPSLNWADEIFQTTEQAHRLVYGTGLVPWEFQVSMRSWLLPGVVAGVMEFASIFGDGPRYYLPATAIACGAFAVVPVLCCFGWCRRWFGVPAALAGALWVAVSPELVYMGGRVLTEVVAAHLFVLGFYLLEPGERPGAPRRYLAAGTVLGLACVLRVQLAPALAPVAAWVALRGSRQQALLLAAGGCAAVALAAILDAATLCAPLASIWRYVAYNLFYGVSSTFGTEPWCYYLFAELAIWRTGLAVVLFLAVLGIHRAWTPLVTALVLVASHSLIAHKEYRFIVPAIELLAVQAGIGLAATVEGLQRRCEGSDRWARLSRRSVPVMAAASCCVLSLLTWRAPVLAALRHRAHDNLVAMSFVATQANVCGVGLYGEHAWIWYGGYTYLHRPIPIYWPSNAAELRNTAPGFDVMLYSIASRSAEPVMPNGFARGTCFGDVCLARRSGSCAAVPPMPMPMPAPFAPGSQPVRADVAGQPGKGPTPQ